MPRGAGQGGCAPLTSTEPSSRTSATKLLGTGAACKGLNSEGLDAPPGAGVAIVVAAAVVDAASVGETHGNTATVYNNLKCLYVCSRVVI